MHIPSPPRRKRLFKCIVLSIVVCCSFAMADEPSRPHVVFVLADDLGFGDVKCFGEERCQIETPHFDRLAAEGMRFTNAHANASVCVPTRMAIMTGRYAWRFGPPQPGGPWGFLGLRFPPQQRTLATMLSNTGYHTGYVGKWHLGTGMQTTDGQPQGFDNVDYQQPLAVGPADYGFHDSFILPGSLDMYPYAFVRNHQWVGPVTAMKGWSAFHRVGPAAEDFVDEQVLDTFGDEAIRFLSAHAKPTAADNRPFFLYLALTSPHTPICPSEPFRGRSKLGIYGDFVMETDHCLGRVLQTLDALGLTENTLVIATSDHGPALYAGRHRKATKNQLRELEQDGHFSSGPFRGYKFSAYEGGLRVPFVVRYPAVVPASTTCTQLIALHDLYATLAELSGSRLAEDECADSLSFVPLLRECDQRAGTRRSMILQSTGALACIVDAGWKLVFCPGSGCAGRYGNAPPDEPAWRAARQHFGRPPRTPGELAQAPFVQLFHLPTDPGEQRNLAVQRPDKIAELVDITQRIIARGRSRHGAPLPNDRAQIPLFRSVPAFVWQP